MISESGLGNFSTLSGGGEQKCRVCGNGVEDHNYSNAVHQLKCCQSCGHAQLASAKDGFEEDLYTYYQERIGKSPEELYSPLTTERQELILDKLAGLTSGRCLLDVGCGQGQFIWTAKRAGWQANGIDLSGSAVAVAKGVGVNAQVQDFFSSELDHLRFDVITMFELIEHVPNPQDFVNRAESLLKTGGVLYLTTPNIASLDARVQKEMWRVIHPEHISYFTPSSMKTLFSISSPAWDILEMRTVNFSIPGLYRALKGVRVRPGRTDGAEDIRKVRLQESRIREKVAGKKSLLLIKQLMNRMLSSAGLGSTMTAIAIKRSR